MNRLILLFILSLSFSCISNRNENKQDKEEQTSHENSDCLPDSCVFKPNFTFHVDELFASPFNENKILLIDYNGISYQTDTDFSKLTNLEEILGYVGRGVRKEGIINDPYNDSLIWVIGFHEGMVIHNRINKKNIEFHSQKYFKGSSLTNICILKDHIWIGSSDGLYKIERKGYKIEELTQFTGIWIKSLLWNNSNELIINDNYILEDKTNEIKPFQTINDTTYTVINYYRYIDKAVAFSYETNKTKIIFPNGKIKHFNYNFPHPQCFLYKDELWDISGKITCYNFQNDASSTVPFSNNINVFTNEDSIVWFASENLIFKLNKNYKSIYQYPVEFSDIYGLFTYKEYLYINHLDRITRLSKQSINKNLLLNDELEKEEEIFNKQLGDIISQSRNEPIETLLSFFRLKKKFINTKNKIIIKKLNEISVNPISYSFKDLSNEDYAILITKLNSIEFQNIRDVILFGLSRSHGINREISKSLKYYNLLKSEYPKSYLLKYFTEKDTLSLKNINEELNSINKEKISEDMKFWKKYQSFQSNSLGNIFEREWLSRPFEYLFLDSIVSLYPKSEFADNAEWIIKQFSNAFRNEEGGIPSFNIKELEFYRHFLSKYPNSELLPEILKDMAYVYTYIGDSIEQRIQNIDTAQFIYNRLQKDYPEFSKKENIEIYNDLKENLLKGNLGWEFLIKTKKLSYTINEPIEIEFILKNKTKYKRTLEFYDGVPNFYIRVLGENEFIEIPKNMDFIKKTIEIEPMGTYHEKWDIKKMIKIEFNNKPGYIKIGNTDGLRIAGTFRFSNSEPFSTDEIQIKIIE